MLRPPKMKGHKIMEWLSAATPKVQGRPPTSDLRPRLGRKMKKTRPHRERQRTASSEASAEVLSAARVARRRRVAKRRERKLSPMRMLILGEGGRDPQRFMEELRRFSEEEAVASSFPRSCSSSCRSPTSRCYRCKKPGEGRRSRTPSSSSEHSNNSYGGNTRTGRGEEKTEDDRQLTPVTRFLRGRQLVLEDPVSPTSFSALRHLPRLALRRVYKEPNDREERRRRFKEEVRKRCGLKVWTWEDLTSSEPLTLASMCRATQPNADDQLRLRKRSYSPRRMSSIVMCMRDELRKYDKGIDAKFVELELAMMPEEKEGEELGAISILLERERLMELRNRANEESKIKKAGESKTNILTSEKYDRVQSARSLMSSRKDLAKAFEQHTLKYIDWETADHSGDEMQSKRKRSNKPYNHFDKALAYPELKILQNNKRAIVDRKVGFGNKAKANNRNENSQIAKNVNNKRNVKKIHISNSSVNCKCVQDSRKSLLQKDKKYLSNKISLTEFSRGKKESKDFKSFTFNPLSKRSVVPQWFSRQLAADYTPSKSLCQPPRLPPLKERVANKSKVSVDEGSVLSFKESGSRVSMKSLTSKFTAIPEIKRSDSKELVNADLVKGPNIFKKIEEKPWARPASGIKVPLPPIREQRMYARAASCLSRSPHERRPHIAPLGKSSQKSSYPF